MTQQVFGPLEEPLWAVDPLISGSKMVGHVTWTPALGGRNLRWIDCFAENVTTTVLELRLVLTFYILGFLGGSLFRCRSQPIERLKIQLVPLIRCNGLYI